MTTDPARTDERFIFGNDPVRLLAKPAARHIVFVVLILCSAISMWTGLKSLVHLSLGDDRYSHILVIPILSAALIYMRRKTVFARSSWNPALALPGFILGEALYFTASGLMASTGGYGLSLRVAGGLLVWIAAFLLCYGRHALAAACFPVSLLLFLIPVPASLLEVFVLFLQRASADVTQVLFKIARVPNFRDGFRFGLPGFDVEIAEQCSGIRSCIAFCITGLVTANLFTHSFSKRLIICLVIVPISIFKNGLRIVIISWLGLHISRDFLHGRLHQNSGLPFSLVGVGLLFVVLLVLRRSDGITISRRNASELQPRRVF